MKNVKGREGFLLTLELVYENLQERGIESWIRIEDLKICLSGVQIYTGQTQASLEFLYLTDVETLRQYPLHQKNIRMVILGEEKEDIIYPSYCIVLPKRYEMFDLLNELQQIFYEYHQLERSLMGILTSEGSIKEVCEVAVKHFRDSVIVHDEYYHILACSQIEGEKNTFTYNEKTDQYTQDAETINYFQTSPAYRKTLTTIGGCIWESDFSEESCLYANLWIGEKYKGRIVIGREKKRIQSGQLAEVSYFASIIEKLLLQQKFSSMNKRYSLEKLMVDALDGKSLEKAEVAEELAELGWGVNDRYLCGYLSFEDSDFTKISVYGISNDIEKHIPYCCTCYYENKLYVVFNMTQGAMNSQSIRMKMSYIIRESMCFMGISLPFSDFCSLRVYFRQAEIAVKYSRSEAVPKWYTEFEEYVLKYWILEGSGEFAPQTMIPETIKNLITYDKIHHTELTNTLRTYLVNERNSTLTAQILKINRSTLPHRLERIQKIVGGVNLEDGKTRMYLLMGFLLVEYLQQK